jgi:hypothetical protein
MGESGSRDQKDGDQSTELNRKLVGEKGIWILGKYDLKEQRDGNWVARKEASCRGDWGDSESPQIAPLLGGRWGV